MLRPDNGNTFVPKGNQRIILLLVVLFGAGQFLNLFFEEAGIGSFRTNDVVDAWILLLCIYAASVARCFPDHPLVAAGHGAAESRLWPFVSFLSLSSVTTLGLAVLVGAIFPSGVVECTVVMGCACQIIAFVALITIGFGGGLLVGNKLASFAIALGLSLVGSGAILIRQSTASLGIVLPVIVLLGWAARDIKLGTQG